MENSQGIGDSLSLSFSTLDSFGAESSWLDSSSFGRFLENQARKYKIGRYKVARKGENGIFEPYYQALYMCDLIKMAH